MLLLKIFRHHVRQALVKSPRENAFTCLATIAVIGPWQSSGDIRMRLGLSQFF
ncbi:hypothetical protein NEUTE2DRAFT_170469 [Neurospora tetrasperma FGSC 2509]|nr:hypothetical protein NEUTE2DRAFT_170469 [Neurospora tetrasperma FGSC 2509]